MSILKVFESARLDSKIKSANVTTKEKVLGYLIGPAGALVFNQVLNSYLNVFYTDALGATAWLGGAFMVFFPIISKIIDAITNLIMANIIDNTRTRQGKLRPYILLSAPILCLSAIMLFAVPNFSQTGKMIWIVISYNLYYSISFTMYYIAQQMMLSASTRNSEQRAQLGIFNQICTFGLGGVIGFAIFPMAIYPILQRDPDKWLSVMAIMAVFILPLVCVQYFYTRERVTEEDIAMGDMGHQKASMLEEFKLLIKDKFWCFYILFFLFQKLAIMITNSSMLYYTNWVAASDYTQGSGYFALLNMVCGGATGFLSMFIMWPLVKKLGKHKLAVVCVGAMGIGSAVCFFVARNFPAVFVGFLITSLGSSVLSALIYSILADVLDEAEWKTGRRADAISGAVLTVIQTVAQGVSAGVLNGVLAAVNYQQPELLLQADGSYASQSPVVQTTLIVVTFGIPAIMYLVATVFLGRANVEKQLPTIVKELMERKKAAAAAAGIEWVDPVEAARKEKEESLARKRENDLAKLQQKCAKNGKDFEAEKKKYDEKLQKRQKKDAARHM